MFKTRIINFKKNISFLLKNNLRVFLEKSIDENVNNFIDNIKYEIDELPIKPIIKPVDDTIDELIKSNKSIARFGDGELQLLNGNDIPFQKHCLEITEKLAEILKSNDENFMVAIPKVLYSDLSNTNFVAKNFWRKNGGNFREILHKYINFKQIYFSAESSICYALYQNYNFDDYFSKIRKILQNQNIILIANEDVFKNIQFNIFDQTKNLEHIIAPKKDAFFEYDLILKNALSSPLKDAFFVIILGPTATILAYDLYKNQRRALDFGHIVSSYDFYMKNHKIDNLESAIKFFDN